jgi:hypothetical protein
VRGFTCSGIRLFLTITAAPATAAGLTVGHEAQLVDLLHPGAAPISLGSAPAAAALRGLSARPVNGPDALAQVR